MAQRRMFSMDIVASDAFLDMPVSSQTLYFHLGMYADDDGFVSPKKTMRLIGASDDDLKVLLGKRFLVAFKNGVVVVKHWKINNYIQKDRYHETKYLEEKRLLNIKENGSYTERIQDVHKMDTQARLGKASQDKSSQDNLAAKPLDEINLIINIFQTINPGINYANLTNRKAAEWLINKYGYEKASSTAEYAVICTGKPYAPTITTPYQLKEKLGSLIAFYKKEMSEGLTKTSKHLKL